VDDEFREELPDEIVVPLEEVRQVLIALERHLEALRDTDELVEAAAVDIVLGQITRWIWPLLRDLDHDEEGYDG